LFETPRFLIRLPYVLMVASMIERRTIRREELIAALRKRIRQHSIGGRNQGFATIPEKV
jgi:hypothetical protein